MSFTEELQKRTGDAFRESQMAGKGGWEPGRVEKIQPEGPGTKVGKRRNEMNKHKIRGRTKG